MIQYSRDPKIRALGSFSAILEYQAIRSGVTVRRPV